MHDLPVLYLWPHPGSSFLLPVQPEPPRSAASARLPPKKTLHRRGPGAAKKRPMAVLILADNPGGDSS